MHYPESDKMTQKIFNYKQMKCKVHCRETKKLKFTQINLNSYLTTILKKSVENLNLHLKQKLNIFKQASNLEAKIHNYI